VPPTIATGSWTEVTLPWLSYVHVVVWSGALAPGALPRAVVDVSCWQYWLNVEYVQVDRRVGSVPPDGGSSCDESMFPLASHVMEVVPPSGRVIFVIRSQLQPEFLS
jgi:hypothetical protein